MALCSFPNPIYSSHLVHFFPIDFSYFSIALGHLLPPYWFHSTFHSFQALHPPTVKFTPVHINLWNKITGPRDFRHSYRYPPPTLPFPLQNGFCILLTIPEDSNLHGLFFFFFLIVTSRVYSLFLICHQWSQVEDWYCGITFFYSILSSFST